MKKTNEINTTATENVVDKKVENRKSKTEVNATKTNAPATALAFTQYEAIYNELIACTTKKQLVDTMNKYGLRTTTIPTTTPNTNDLYIQFSDKSRLLIAKKTMKLYTNDARKSEFPGLQFDKVNDGSYRTTRATIAKSLENFKAVFAVFMNCADNYLPTATAQ
jgi:hypothetical protein